MKTIADHAIFLAILAGEERPFNSRDRIAKPLPASLSLHPGPSGMP